MDIFNKIKAILFNPEKFFLGLNKEKSLQDALLFYIILLAFSSIMSYLVTLIFGTSYIGVFYKLFNLNLPIPKFNALFLFGQIIVGYVLSVLLSFVVVAILYVWLLIFSGNKGYSKAYQLYIYSQTPSLLIKWIPVLGLFAWIYSLVLLIIGTKKIYNFSTTKSVLIYVIPLLIILIFALIFFALFLLIGSTSGPFSPLSNLPKLS